MVRIEGQEGIQKNRPFQILSNSIIVNVRPEQRYVCSDVRAFSRVGRSIEGTKCVNIWSWLGLLGVLENSEKEDGIHDNIYWSSYKLSESARL